MLIAVERSESENLVRALERYATPVAAQIGEVVEQRDGLLEVIP
jgi:hypothetical protein